MLLTRPPASMWSSVAFIPARPDCIRVRRATGLYVSSCVRAACPSRSRDGPVMRGCANCCIGACQSPGGRRPRPGGALLGAWVRVASLRTSQLPCKRLFEKGTSVSSAGSAPAGAAGTIARRAPARLTQQQGGERERLDRSAHRAHPSTDSSSARWIHRLRLAASASALPRTAAWRPTVPALALRQPMQSGFASAGGIGFGPSVDAVGFWLCCRRGRRRLWRCVRFAAWPRRRRWRLPDWEWHQHWQPSERGDAQAPASLALRRRRRAGRLTPGLRVRAHGKQPSQPSERRRQGPDGPPRPSCRPSAAPVAPPARGPFGARRTAWPQSSWRRQRLQGQLRLQGPGQVGDGAGGRGGGASRHPTPAAKKGRFNAPRQGRPVLAAAAAPPRPSPMGNRERCHPRRRPRPPRRGLLGRRTARAPA